MTGEVTDELPATSPSEMIGLLDGITAPRAPRRIGILLAAAAWLIDRHYVGPARAAMIEASQRRLAAHAELLRHQVRGRA